MNILITGGAGFIGSHLTKKLINNGHYVRILDNLSPQIHSSTPYWLENKNIDFIEGCITNRSIIHDSIKDIEVVIHLAAETGTGQSMYEVSKYYDVNVMGTAQLFDVLTNEEAISVKKVLLASSRSVYGEGSYICKNIECKKQNLRQFPDSRSFEVLSNHNWDHSCSECGSKLSCCSTKESDKISPASIYAASKYAQEDIIRIGSNALSIDYAIFRLQNVYGPWQSLENPYTGILSIFSTKIRNNKEIQVFEDGKESRDFVNVDDVAEIFSRAVDYDKKISDVINVGSGIATSVFDIAKHLVSAFNIKVPINVTSNFRVGDIRNNYANTSKLKYYFDYSPSTSIEDGISEFVDWVNTQPIKDDRLSSANSELMKRDLMG